MTRADFVRKWSKRASAGRSVEEFERDVEALVQGSIRNAMTALSNGIVRATARFQLPAERRILKLVSREILPAVERALMKYNGIEEEGEGHEGGEARPGRGS